MRLNKKGKNFLLGTLLKGYFVQLVICSVVVMIGTIVLDLVASSLSRRWFGNYSFGITERFMHLRRGLLYGRSVLYG